MAYVTLDALGKIYFPKVLREKIKDRKFIALVLPDGDVVLHRKAARTSLEEFQKLPKLTKSLAQTKKEILEEASKEVK